MAEKITSSAGLAFYSSTEDGIYLSSSDLMQSQVDAIIVELEDTVISSQVNQPQWHLLPQAIHPWPKDVIVDLRQRDFSKPTWLIRSPLNGQKFTIHWQPWLADAMANLSCYWMLPDGAMASVDTLSTERIVSCQPIASRSNAFEISSARAEKRWVFFEDLGRDSVAGNIINADESFCVLDESWQTSVRLLADNCVCGACITGLQRGYFHHLHQHVPLLSSRYITMHNLAQANFSF